jgi:PAS domain S-box-containing protein
MASISLNENSVGKQNREGGEHITSRFGVTQVLPVVAVPLSAVLLFIFYLLGSDAVFERPLLLLALNTVFLTVCPLVVVYVATRGYLTSGVPILIMLGSATLMFGLGSLGAALTLQWAGPNAVVTVHNVCALGSAAIHLLGATLAFGGLTPQRNNTRKRLNLVGAYLVTTLLVTVLTFGAVNDWFPVFFIQGSGPTPLRQAVLETAALLFLVAGFLIGGLFLLSRASFTYWYSLALFLISVGLFCILLQKSVGGPIGWLGRSVQYLGGIYLLVGVFRGARELRERGSTIQTGIADLFRHRLEVVVEERTAQLRETNEQLSHEIAERKLAEEQLKTAHTGLEVKVQERTAEISEANEALRKEMADRTRTQEELTLTLARLTGLLDALPDLVHFKDIEGRFILVNKTYQQFLGVGQEDILGKSVDQLVPADLAAQARSADEEVYQRRESLHSEEMTVGKKGEPVFFDTIKFPVFDDRGQALGLGGVSRDITDRKNSDEAISERTAALERANRELEHFAYVASHDLREPLRKISNFTELLANRYKGKLDEKADKYIWYVVDGAQRMERLIDDLLTYSRAGRTELQLETTSVDHELNKTLADLEMLVRETGAEVISAPLPVVKADSTQLRRVLQNLIANAVKFRGQEAPRIHVSAEKRNSEWVFSIRDNGIGFDPEQSDRIFALFQRLHTRTEYPGTGIGLAVCKKIVERHGGRIWAESEPGKGSVFCFTLPDVT